MKKKITVVLFLVVAVTLGIAGNKPPQDQPKRNLKVLPKNISAEELDSIMDGFKAALNVKCDFCHAQRKDDPKKLDFGSDDKPEKEIARGMLRMTSKINKKFFKFKGGKEADGSAILPPVTCMTCHNGQPHPATK
jgi:hypothetical protein